MTTRESLHAMLDELPDEELKQLQVWLEAQRERRAFVEMLEKAPYDEEPLTEAEVEALERSKDDFSNGRWVPHEDVERMIADQ